MRWMIAALMLVATSVSAVDGQLVEVTATKLNVRASPSAGAPIINQVSKGDQIFVSPVSDRWAAISREGEMNGFLSTRYLKVLQQRNETEDQLLMFFLALLSAAILVAVTPVRPSKDQSIDNKTERLKHDAEVATTCPRVLLDETLTVRRNSRSARQTVVLNEAEGLRDIQDFPMAKVEHVIDGDTVIVSSIWKKTKVRLDSIDCPEDGQHWGDIATAGLIKMIGGRRVHIEGHGEDHYGRLLATIFVQDRRGSDWVNVNEKMVAKGHAWVMRRYYDHLPVDRKNKLNRLEQWARRRKVGLWNTPQPIPPWKWRREGAGHRLKT